MSYTIAETESFTCRSCRRLALGGFLVLALTFASGCGGAEGPATGTVAGLITYKGKPVTAGTITFRDDKKGQVASMGLGADGRYELRFAGGKDIPVGEYVVIISPLEPHVPIASEIAAGAKPATVLVGDSKEIPQKYRSPQTSGLKYSVVPGPNTFDVDMQD